MGDNTTPDRHSVENLGDRILEWKPFEGGDSDAGSEINIDRLEPYRYRPLANPGRDIRLLNLMPGQPEDPIRISIFHTTLSDEPQPKRPPTRLPIAEIKAKLPRRWKVEETIEGRYIFNGGRNRAKRWQWEFPNDDLDPSLYNTSDDDIPCFQPHYEALSYTWGPTGGGGNVIVQEEASKSGDLSLKRLHLQGNLMTVLPWLRDADSPRTFWIDSICINQADDQEKGHQVHRMAVIYRGAYRVVVWLGPEDAATSRTMQLLEYVGHQIEVLQGPDDYYIPALTTAPNPLEVEFPLSSTTLDEIDTFLHNPWFRRLWIVQEIRLANRRAILQCGRSTMPFTLFKRAVTYLDTDVHSMHYLDYLFLGSTLCRSSMFMSFYRVVSLLRENRCGDPRDKIYGVLGLVPPKFGARVQPEYLNSVGDVYRDIVLLHAEHTGRLEHLEYTHQWDRDEAINTPSWVPDFTSKHFRQTSCGYQQHASGFSRCDISYEAPRSLLVVGKHCATVSTVSDRFPRYYRDSYAGLAMLNKWHSLSSEVATHPTGVPFSEAFANTILQGVLQDRRRDNKHRFLPSEQWQDLAHRLLQFTQDTDVASLADDELSITYIREAFRYCVGYSYILTPEGYFGLAPPTTKKGDFLCILLGCASPVVLRGTRPGHFEVVGTCYMYGLQDAIGLLGPFPEPWQGVLENRPGIRRRLVFYNTETGTYSYNDPRLGDLGDWERFDRETEPDDPEILEYYRNIKTGEVMDSDPRMLPEALKARGVELKTFVLE
ncbi:heterokaryon incompatibility protein-domain-containing protein [Cercophora newfieldiana]|uniref:Heterokaryon incompatibility protein-domain-containing protein n=1 Tax=Cercophora newfieldiana TaxID=92897 RepID=A0AA39YUI3_9PEZI|nr:heterokaryon incompatibility protein-domain-containing protein [Cercophora newfieldiana]